MHNFFCISTFCIFVMKMSLTNSDSSSPSLQFFANSDSVSWNFSKDSFSFCLRPKKLNLSFVRFLVTVKVVFSNSQNSAKFMSSILFPGFLCEKNFCPSHPSARYSCDFNFLSTSPIWKPLNFALSSAFLLLI